MGQIFDRVKFLIRAYINAARGKSTETSDEPIDKRSHRFYYEWLQKAGLNKEALKSNEDFQRAATEWDRTNHSNYPLRKSYSVLGVKFGASLEIVKRRWKELIQKNHPDVVDQPKRKMAEKISQEINEAYKNIENFFEKNTK